MVRASNFFYEREKLKPVPAHRLFKSEHKPKQATFAISSFRRKMWHGNADQDQAPGTTTDSLEVGDLRR
jgi:hypothetical protein